MRCIYCNLREANTKDHVPPKCIFPPGTKKHMITVPACSDCNNLYSIEDEYFKIALTIRVGDDSKASKALSLSTSRSLEKNKKLDDFVIASVLSLNDAKITYSWQRFRPFIIAELKRITKAIYFDIYQAILSEETTINIYDELKPGMHSIDIFKELEVIPIHRITNIDIFSCEYSTIPDDQNTGIWRYNFYNRYFPHVISLSDRMQKKLEL
jgi:hypothetical protein